MMRFGHNLKTLDAEIKYVGTVDGDSTATVKRIKDKIAHKKFNLRCLIKKINLK